MSEKIKELRKKAEEMIAFGKTMDKARGKGMLAVLNALEEEEDFKFRLTFVKTDKGVRVDTESREGTLAEIVGLLELEKLRLIKKFDDGRESN
jgi:hypothetical protein